MAKKTTAGFIGCGNMGGVLAGVAAKALGGDNVYVFDKHPEKTGKLSLNYGCKITELPEMLEKCGIIVLGVKPQALSGLLESIKEPLSKRTDRYTVVSMAAGVKTSAIEAALGDVPVVRIMPNTPCASGEGVILCSEGSFAGEEDMAAVLKMFEPAGRLLTMPESKIDAGCAVSGCGPAFVFMFIDALIDGGVRAGLTRAEAKLLAEQTVLGSAKYALETGVEPAKLKADVCSPKGSTIEGVAVLEEYSLRSAVMEAVKASYERTVELGK
jgi:pyrroline-5-carboxylate reductase